MNLRRALACATAESILLDTFVYRSWQDLWLLVSSMDD
jgi:hypothetical protein